MNKELEEAIERLKNTIKNIKEYGTFYAVTDEDQHAIETVLQALEYYKKEYKVKELQLHLLREETNNKSFKSIQTISIRNSERRKE